MSDEFHAVFTPGTQIKISDTLTMTFDSPKEADPVTVTLSEIDEWGSGGGKVTETGGEELIAEFKGKIEKGKFVGTLSKSGKSTTTGAPTMKLRFDGEAASSAHSLPMPDATLANENGIFEVRVKVSGTINKKAKNFTAPSPVFVRNFKAGRPVVAFITGSGGFFAGADGFMEKYADGKFARSSVLEIREFLRTQSTAAGFGPWGEANAVSHGNAVEWVIKLEPGDANARHLRKWHVEEAAKDPRFAPVITAALDKDSKFVIRGCAIGNDQGLLDQVRILFGGACTVLAPKFLQFYETKGATARESFFEFFHFFAKAETPPSDAVCVAELKKKFPSAGISDKEWTRMLSSRAFDPNGFRASDASGSADRKETIPWKEELTVNHPATPKKKLADPAPDPVQDAAGKFDWAGRAKGHFDTATPKENLETTFDDWKFVEGPLQEKPIDLTSTKFIKELTGHRVRIEVRRELRDASGTPVKPDLTNPAHYGKSPK